ncbi:hypothetical protein Plhal304r1_c010g0040151 [Plasmopara halstedii]
MRRYVVLVEKSSRDFVSRSFVQTPFETGNYKLTVEESGSEVVMDDPSLSLFDGTSRSNIAWARQVEQ